MGLKKALLLSHSHPGQGTYYRCFYFAKSLSLAGYKVDIICASAREGDWGVRRRMVSETLSITTLPSPIRPGSPLAQVARTLLGTWRVFTGGYDVIHAFGFALPSISIPVILARRMGLKAKIILDWDSARGDAPAGMFSQFSHAARKLMENKITLVARPDAVTAVSRYFHIRLLKMELPMSRISVVPNGCDTETVKPMSREAARAGVEWNPDEQVILSMGHNYSGSLRALLEAFALVRAKKPKAKLKMLGYMAKTGKQAEKVDEVLREFAHLSPHIEWLGEAPRREVGKYLCAADCLALPMENSVTDGARGPVRLGDYLASGRPVASNAVGYTREILDSISPNAVCEDPDDRREFARIIIRVLEDPAFAQAVGKAGLELAQGRLNWRTVGAEVVAIHDGLF